MLLKTWMFALVALSSTTTAWSQAVMLTQVAGEVTVSGNAGMHLGATPLRPR